MTEPPSYTRSVPPPLPPLPSIAQPPQEPGPTDPFSVIPAVIAWVIIAACVGLIMLAGLRPPPPEPLAVEADRLPAVAPDFLIQSRLVVGSHALWGPAASAPLLPAVEEADGRSPADRFRAALVVGELHGADAAIRKLDGFDRADLPASLRRDAEVLRRRYERGPDAVTPAERETLIRAHGWFARLALARGLPPDDPDRRAAIEPAKRAAVTVFAFFGVGGLGFVIGLVLLILALVRWLSGQGMRPAYVPPPAGRSGPFVEAFALYLFGMIVASALVGRLSGDRPSFAANFWIAAAVPLPLIWPRLRGMSWAEVRAGFGWHAGRGLFAEAGAGVLGYLAGLPLLLAAVLFTSFLAKASGTTPTHPIVTEAAGGGGGGAGGAAFHVFQLYALAAVYAPLIEELMFRGALYHHTRRRLPAWAAALLVGLIFAAIHPQGWVGIPMLATIALVLAALREWRGSIIAPVVGHACVNGVTVTMLVLMTT